MMKYPMAARIAIRIYCFILAFIIGPSGIEFRIATFDFMAYGYNSIKSSLKRQYWTVFSDTTI
jgi:hypothetical protein